MPSLRRLLTGMVCCLLLMNTVPASGQVQVLQPDDDSERPQPQAAAPGEPEPQVMVVSPAAEPDPPLHWWFWPTKQVLRPGNAVVPVQRALAMYQDDLIQQARGGDTELAERWSDWMESDLADLPREEIRTYLNRHQSALNELYRIAVLERTDYDVRQFHELPALEVYGLLLPEVQNMRALAWLLNLDTRLALAEGRHNDAIRSIQASVRLGEVAASTSPTLISRLVGIAIAGMAVEQARLAATLPDAPNYYWALATLPDSLWDVRPALEFELGVLSRSLPSLHKFPEESASESAWRGRLLSAVRQFTLLGDMRMVEPESVVEQYEPQVRFIAGVIAVTLDGVARERLERAGEDPSDMSPSEVILRATRRDLLRVHDDQLKWILLPESIDLPQLPEGPYFRMPWELDEDDGSLFPAAGALVQLMLPAHQAALHAGQRGRQTVALLATVEALRMHAARHGQFPESLDQLDPVPAWPDPVTREPFTYEHRSPTEVVLKRAADVHRIHPELVLQLRNR